MMKAGEVIQLVLGTMTIVILPTLALLFRLTVKWTTLEHGLVTMSEKLEKLVADKDKTHALILDQMTRDREATDRRLTWLEHNVWRKIEGKEN